MCGFTHGLHTIKTVQKGWSYEQEHWRINIFRDEDKNVSLHSWEPNSAMWSVFSSAFPCFQKDHLNRLRVPKRELFPLLEVEKGLTSTTLLPSFRVWGLLCGHLHEYPGESHTSHNDHEILSQAKQGQTFSIQTLKSPFHNNQSCHIFFCGSPLQWHRILTITGGKKATCRLDHNGIEWQPVTLEVGVSTLN